MPDLRLPTRIPAILPTHIDRGVIYPSRNTVDEIERRGSHVTLGARVCVHPPPHLYIQYIHICAVYTAYGADARGYTFAHEDTRPFPPFRTYAHTHHVSAVHSQAARAFSAVAQRAAHLSRALPECI